MQFIGVRESDLVFALEKVNERYMGNVCFNNFELVRERRDGTQVWRVTLRTRSSRGPGAGRSARVPGWVKEVGGRRMTTACWHAHGHFLDALGERCPEAEVVISWGERRRCLVSEHGWEDAYRGNAFGGQMFSEMCDCGGE